VKNPPATGLLDSDEYRHFHRVHSRNFEGPRGRVLLMGSLLVGSLPASLVAGLVSTGLLFLGEEGVSLWALVPAWVLLLALTLFLAVLFAALLTVALKHLSMRRAYPSASDLPSWAPHSRHFRSRARRYARKHLSPGSRETLAVLSREVDTDLATLVALAKEL
jgi:hypothetical protein